MGEGREAWGPALPAGSDGATRSLSGRRAPARQEDVGSQPGGHSSSQGSGAWVRFARSGLTGLLQVGLPVRGPLPPWLPQRSLLTQIFLEALHVKKLPTELGWRFLGKPPGCVEQQAAGCSSRGGGPGTDLQGRREKRDREGAAGGRGWGERAGMLSGPSACWKS